MIPPLPASHPVKIHNIFLFPLCCFYLSSGNYYTLPHFFDSYILLYPMKKQLSHGILRQLPWVLILPPLSASGRVAKCPVYRMSSLIVYWF